MRVKKKKKMGKNSIVKVCQAVKVIDLWYVSALKIFYFK